MRVLRGKKALVTGAAHGIGRAIAIALAKEGVALWLIDIDSPELSATAAEARSHGVDAVEWICDLANPPEITLAVRNLLSTWNRLDILVNNAGVAYFGPTRDMTDAQWARLLAINLLAPIQLVRELIDTLLAQKEAHIVNICSALGLVPFRNAAAYQTSKFGLVGFTQALHGEFARRRFGITAVCPGFVHTAMIAPWLSRFPPWVSCATPQKVAAKTVSAIRRNKSLVVITLTARLGWWLTRLSPGLAAWVNREVSRWW
jgi:3-oxoacyl-[acyl-carrier protein] reductase